MKVAVRYYTKTGNTEKLAKAVADAVGAEALPISEPIDEPVDLLFLGNSYYAFSIDPEVRDYVRSLDSSKVKRIRRSLPNTSLSFRMLMRIQSVLPPIGWKNKCFLLPSTSFSVS